MKKQGPRTRALDSRGRPVPRLYVRDGRYIAGFQQNSRWRMQTLERGPSPRPSASAILLLAGPREGRVANPDGARGFADPLFDEVAAGTARFHPHRRARALPARSASGNAEGKEGAKHHGVRPRPPARGMREDYSGWTASAVYRILKGTFGLAQRRGTGHGESVRRAHDRRAPEAKEREEDRASRQRDHDQTHRRRGGRSAGRLPSRLLVSEGFARGRFAGFSGTTSTSQGTRSASSARCSSTAARRRPRSRQGSAWSRSSPSCGACY